MRGFTLIELLVSLTILGVILTLLGSGLRVMAKNWDANAHRIDDLDMISRAFDILHRDALNLQRVVAPIDGKPFFLFTGTPQHMSFVVLEPPFPTQPGPYFVDYSVVPNGENSNLIRARAQYHKGTLQFPGATPANRVPLLQGNYRYKFSYGQRDKGAESWYGLWPYPNSLPDLIRLEIFERASGELLAPAIIARIRADAELNCLSSKAKLCTAKTNGVLKTIANPQPKKKPEGDHNE